MDGDRFDALSRSLTLVGSRCRSLMTILGVVLGRLGLAEYNDAAAAKSGTCQCQPGDGKTCKKG